MSVLSHGHSCEATVYQCPARSWTAHWQIMILLIVVGCNQGDGRQRVQVKGTVSFQGQPISSGSIAFVPLPGTESPKVHESIRDGRYMANTHGGLLIGKYRVEINATGAPRTSGDFNLPPTELIPAKYNIESTLTMDLTDVTELQLERSYELRP